MLPRSRALWPPPSAILIKVNLLPRNRGRPNGAPPGLPRSRGSGRAPCAHPRRGPSRVQRCRLAPAARKLAQDLVRDAQSVARVREQWCCVDTGAHDVVHDRAQVLLSDATHGAQHQCMRQEARRLDHARVARERAGGAKLRVAFDLVDKTRVTGRDDMWRRRASPRLDVGAPCAERAEPLGEGEPAQVRQISPKVRKSRVALAVVAKQEEAHAAGVPFVEQQRLELVADLLTMAWRARGTSAH